ncbi:glycosyltransferase [Desulfococcaceae bacterium HSG9]|nr:glycosyltransferase [Desulfococcaceae bacterium HSG9]
MANSNELPAIDCVIIGINSEHTLADCINSLKAADYPQAKINIIYVDGGSTDNSIAVAKSFADVQTIALNPEYPTPGIGRNAGWRAGDAPLVHFFDSDVIVAETWLKSAVKEIKTGIGAVSGRLQERFPDVSAYNWIAEQEWNYPAGEAQAFGGIAMLRRELLEQTGGYDEILVGGEDPELAVRARLSGWKILHVTDLMAYHDIAMTRLSQYWKRTFRTGYAYAAVTARHWKNDRGFWIHELFRITIRGGCFIFAIPLSIGLSVISLWFFLLPLASALLLFFPRLFRVAYFMQDKSMNLKQARLYAWHCSLIVIPEFCGALRYFIGTALFRKPLRNL